MDEKYSEFLYLLFGAVLKRESWSLEILSGILDDFLKTQVKLSNFSYIYALKKICIKYFIKHDGYKYKNEVNKSSF